MSAPEFKAGDSGQVVGYGVEYRVRAGRKGPTDLVLDIRTDGWVPAPMNLGFLFADFFTQNEERLYPSQVGLQGGGMYARACREASAKGWQASVSRLKWEREQREARKRRESA